jgi:hypothetical protein
VIFLSRPDRLSPPRAWRRLARRPRRRRASRQAARSGSRGALAVTARAYAPTTEAGAAPAARAARLGSRGALAVTALAAVDEVGGERRARERSCLEGVRLRRDG